MASEPRSFTGVRRDRKTHWSVKVIDRAAKVIISVGGIGTIAAVMMVALFLVWVVYPLFLPASIEDNQRIEEVLPSSTAAEPLHTDIDDRQTIGWAAFRDGTYRVFRLNNGELIAEGRYHDESGPAMTSWHFNSYSSDVALGFADGSVRIGTMDMTVEFLVSDEYREMLSDLEVDEYRNFEGGLVTRTERGQLRKISLAVEFGDALVGENKNAVTQLDLSVRSNGTVFTAYHEDGSLFINSVRSRKNLMTGKTTYQLKEAQLPAPGREDAPLSVKLSRLGDTVYLLWEDGEIVRYDTRDIKSATIAETLDVVDQGTITAAEFLIGRSTLLIGDSQGGLYAWFRTKPEGATTVDGAIMERVHELIPAGTNNPVTDIDVSARSRVAAVAFESGDVRLLNVTSYKVLADVEFDDTIEALGLAPRDNGLLALGNGTIQHWKLDLRHPEITVAALFTPVWYEGYNNPSHVWQSSSGTDDFEPKYGLWPLIFGTLKATVYSMAFAIPLALLAAIYTSEFLSPKVRSRVKPAIELMASLPSVVLGFLAGLVFAPFVEEWLGATLGIFVTVPLAFLLGAYLWQLIPLPKAIALRPYRLGLILLFLPLGVLASVPVGEFIVEILFSGSVKLWLDGQIGSGVGGWILILFPLSLLVAGMVIIPRIDIYTRQAGSGWSGWQCGMVELAKFMGLVLAAAILSTVAGMLLNGIGWDPRGSLVDTYVQRNALIVGFAMGFAVIPIIYTIAEDALSTVPEHLRSASLGAGATQWQTATRIIIPTAMSGLFSAIMVGLGRAVGETMIVLMAAGNTPIMEWNLFNGFRTLSANIAVELPEAVRNSTHYRTLFLAALTLFVLTFLINTVAEVIRIRFRKRAYQL